MPRAALNKPVEPDSDVRFIPSGSVLLDLMLGGGWAEGRLSRVVGDRSAGKTLLAIEASANFRRLHRSNPIAYRECEAAFDLPYAHSMGLPRDVDWLDEADALRTIEDWGRDLGKWLDQIPRDTPNMYILDSVDALSSDAEMKRELGEATYGTEKARLISELFRKHIADVRAKHCTLIAISQTRDKIGVTFGETKTTAGGRALFFYASQEIWLHEIKKIEHTVSGVKRVTGVEIRARNKKNKVGTPFRQVDLGILFNYGVDDEASMLGWLHANKGEAYLSQSLNYMTKQLKEARDARDREALSLIQAELESATRARWEEIEKALAPSLSKYGD